MGEVINIKDYLDKQIDNEIEQLSEKLANIISELDLTNDFEMYVTDEGYDASIPYTYMLHNLSQRPYFPTNAQAQSLSDITDVLTSATLRLDELGYGKWSQKLSDLVGDMFVSGVFE